MNMAVFSQQLYFFYLVLLISIMSSLFLMMNLVYAGRPTGFSLELIHNDFLESKNLSQLERMERAFQQTKALDRRQQQLTAAASSMNSSWVSNTTGGSKFIETYHFDCYVVKIGIGSIDEGEKVESMLYYLGFDTGSDLLWLQCVGAMDPFPQNYPYFPWHQSSTFNPVQCGDHVLCPTGECYDQFDHQPCKYNILYVDGSSTTGFLAKDTLLVSLGKFENFIFGCGMSQMNFGLKMGTKAVGIMGFGGGSESFVSQLGLTKFEYCLLPSWTVSTESGPSTFLRFGSDTKIGAGGGQVVHTTPMYIARGTIYYATMIGISVGGTQIRYDNDELRLKSDGTGGCVFDTGTPYSSLSTAVFVPLQAYLLQYYHTLTRHPPPPLTLYEICFEFPIWFEDFPEIIFHFNGGADFHIETKAAFAMYNDFFCFNLIRRDGSGASVVVGGIIQGNHRILYDIGQQRLSWALENCGVNP